MPARRYQTVDNLAILRETPRWSHEKERVDGFKCQDNMNSVQGRQVVPWGWIRQWLLLGSVVSSVPKQRHPILEAKKNEEVKLVARMLSDVYNYIYQKHCSSSYAESAR